MRTRMQSGWLGTLGVTLALALAVGCDGTAEGGADAVGTDTAVGPDLGPDLAAGADARDDALLPTDVAPPPEDVPVSAPDLAADDAPGPLPDGGAPDAAPDAVSDVAAPAPLAADRARLAAFLEAFSAPAMEGRLTGTPAGDRAEEVVIEALTEAGLDVRTQSVSFPLSAFEGPADLSVVDETDVPVTTLRYFEEFREVDFSGSGSVTGPLVFVGYGAVRGDYDSYAGLDVTGTVVAVLTGKPAGTALTAADARLDTKIDVAFDHGAAGVVFVLAGSDATSAAEQGVEMELWAVDDYLDLHADLVHAELPAAFVHLGATEALLGRSAPDLVADPTSVDTGRRVHLEIHGTILPEAACRNVFGVLAGSDPELADEVVILGGHYDHLGRGADGTIFPGAADNATGTGVVLEAARTLAATGRAPKRTIVFAFWCGEEQGLRGSYHYVYADPLFPLRDTQLMVQVDYLGEENGPYLLNYVGEGLSATFFGDADEDPDLPVVPYDAEGGCASDDCPFLWMNVPAYRFLSEGAHHHRPTDTFDTLNLDIVARVADVCIQGFAAVAF